VDKLYSESDSRILASRSMDRTLSAKKQSFSNTRLSSFNSFGPIGVPGLVGDLILIRKEYSVKIVRSNNKITNGVQKEGR